MNATITAVSLSSGHTFSKQAFEHITLLEGLGVEGDAHCGITVKHRSDVARDPTRLNLRQVHLIHSELFDELHQQGFAVEASMLGENVTTRGVDLLALPVDTELQLGDDAVVRLTGLRNPCSQIDGLQKGLLSAVVERRPDGEIIRKTGVMAVVIKGGVVRQGDELIVNLPALPHRKLERV